ncbi:MAG TPA: FAD-dependent oxidoreductase [Clostridiaceae bacterium]|nr:FAD-dependent oxidoreductase [Clostridiaceae bacterium]
MNELVKNHFDGDITIIDKKGVYPYNTYPLSKEWMLEEDDMEPPLLKEKEYYAENNIDLRLNTKVDLINPEEQSVTTHLGETIYYDYLVIATGSKLRKLELFGDDAEGVFYLREFNDAKRIKQWAKDIENVVIIGSGFIGLELASTFSQLGKKVSIIEKFGKPLERILGEQVSDYFTKMHQSHNVSFFLNEETERLIKDEEGKIASVQTINGNNIKAEMVLVAVGVEPDVSVEIKSLDTDRGIIVNRFGETNLARIYAGGDVAMWPYKNKLIHVEHWETAWSQGISIARNILNEENSEYTVDPYFWTDQYDETFEYLGNARTWDKTLIRGKLNEGKFAVAYVDENNFPLAILFANKFEKRKNIQALLSKKQTLDESRFANINIPVEEV